MFSLAKVYYDNMMWHAKEVVFLFWLYFYFLNFFAWDCQTLFVSWLIKDLLDCTLMWCFVLVKFILSKLTISISSNGELYKYYLILLLQNKKKLCLVKMHLFFFIFTLRFIFKMPPFLFFNVWGYLYVLKIYGNLVYGSTVKIIFFFFLRKELVFLNLFSPLVKD